MLKELAAGKKVSGVKQSRRAVRDGLAKSVYIARDADPAVTGPVLSLCQTQNVPVHCGFSMRELGQAAGIQVGAAVVTLIAP